MASVSVLIVFSEAIYWADDDYETTSSCSTVRNEGIKEVFEPIFFILILILFLDFLFFESLSLKLSPKSASISRLTL